MLSASSTSSVRRWFAIAQPTTRLGVDETELARLTAKGVVGETLVD